MSSIQEEIFSIHKELKKALQPETDKAAVEERVVEVLRALTELDISASTISESKIPLTVRALKKMFPNNTFILQTSRNLVGKWKQTYRNQILKVSNDPPKVNAASSKSVRLLNTQKPDHYANCMRNNTYTITFGDQAENHVGMQKIGTLSSEGFDVQDLQRAREWFEGRGISCEMIPLHTELLAPDCAGDEAYVLVARNGVDALGDEAFRRAVFEEQADLKPDRQAFMYGRVVNKHARYNLCFGNFNQDADYKNGKGTVVSFENVPALQHIRNSLVDIIGPKAQHLEAEGNYYYDLSKCGIGFHGDSERMKVVALRLGASMQLCYAWFQQSKPISQRKVITLHHGDMYFMSQKATGQDWKRKVIPTLRHSAGAKKFTQLPAV